MIIRGGKVFSVEKVQERGRTVRKGHFQVKDVVINKERKFF